jgi:hypothetical protein
MDIQMHLSGGSSFPCHTPEEFMGLARPGLSDPVLGDIHLGHVQLCPQNFGGGILDESRVTALQATYPDTRFRLHANARILEEPCSYDLGTAHRFPKYTARLVDMLRFLGEPYSIHAASNGMPIIDQVMMANILSKQAGVPVAIEGLYPSRSGNTVASWSGYAELLKHNVYFVIDLSHLNIVRQAEGEPPVGLVESLLGHSRCIEVHVSGNDGTRDRHEALRGNEWWLNLLAGVNPDAVIFYEGRHPAKGA